MASTEKDSSPSLKSTGPKAIPADSPLLRPSTPQSPGSRRARELQRDARKARNFRSSLERSGSRSRGKTFLLGLAKKIGLGMPENFKGMPGKHGISGQVWKDPDPEVEIRHFY